MPKEVEPEPIDAIEAPITINIGNICGGAIIDAFEGELDKCLANIFDLNTPPTASRTITLKVKLKPDDARTRIISTFDCDSSLAAPHPVSSVFYVGKDKESGKLYGLTHDPRQTAIVFEQPKPKEVPAPIQFKSTK